MCHFVKKKNERKKEKWLFFFTSPCAQVCICVSVRGLLMDYEGAHIGPTPGPQCSSLTSKYTPEHPGAMTPGCPRTSCWENRGVAACDRTTCFRCQGINLLQPFHVPPTALTDITPARQDRQLLNMWIKKATKNSYERGSTQNMWA